jgi:hypothetical protein
MKDASIIFKTKNNNFKINKELPIDVQISNKDIMFNLKLTNIYNKSNESLLKFDSANIAIPINLKNISIKIPKQNVNKLQNTNKLPIIRNPYIYSNVESGYSARSFPQVYIQRYIYGPQGDKPQTTPQVAPVYSPR